MARTIQILITAEDKASGAFHRVSESAGGLNSSLTGMLSVAGGQLLANAISGIGRFMSSIVGGAKEAVSNAQNLEIAIEGLLTQSLMYQQVNEVRQEAIGLTEEEQTKLAKLTASLDVQNARMQEQREKIRQMSEEWTDAGLNVQTAQARLAEMEVKAAETQSTIEELTAKQGEFSTVTESSWQQMLSFADAQGLAKEQAKDLLQYISELAVLSPFETSQVEQVAKIGLAARLSTDQVKAFSAAFLDYSAVAGITSENLAFAADQFLQLKKVGKLTEIDLRQLRRLGIDVAQVLGVEMGMSVEEFNERVGESPELMDELINSFIKFAGETTAGAAERMGQTVSGLESALNDIVELGSRNLFRPIVEAASPYAAELIGRLAAVATGPEISQVGQNLADGIMSGFRAVLSKGQQLAGAAREGGLAGVGGVILADLRAAWPGIQAELEMWGQQFWNWLTETALPMGKEKLLELGGVVEEAWPGIKAQLAEWGKQFWDWLRTTAIPEAKTRLDELAATIVEWSEDPGTSAKMNALGETIGKAIVDGAVGAAVGTYLTLKTGDMFKSLPNALAQTTANVGADIASGIVSGIGEKLKIDLSSVFTTVLGGLGVEDAKTWGTRLAAALEEGFKEGLKTTFSLLNPIAFIREQAGNVGGGIQSARELGTSLAGDGFSLSALLGLDGEQVNRDAGDAAGRVTSALRSVLPDAVTESGIGRQFLGGMSEDIDGADEEKKALANAITAGLPDHVAREAGVTGQAFLESLTTYVSLRLGLGAEARP